MSTPKEHHLVEDVVVEVTLDADPELAGIQAARTSDTRIPGR